MTPSDSPTPARDSRRRRNQDDGRYITKLTDDTIDRITGALRSGANLGDAAAYAGIRRSTLHEWMRLAREPDPPPRLLEFMDQVDEAIATWKVGAVGQLTRLGNEGNSRSYEFLLERRFPQEFGRRQVLEHANADGEPFRVQAIPMFDPNLLTLDELRELERLMTKGRPDNLPIIDAA